jgi:hypothetical protein
MKGEKERGGEKEDMHLEEPNRGRSSSIRSHHRRRYLTNPSKEKRSGGGGEVEEEIEGGDETEKEMEGGEEETYLLLSSSPPAPRGRQRRHRLPSLRESGSPGVEAWFITQVDPGGSGWAKNQSQRCQMCFLYRQENSPPRELDSAPRGFSVRFHPFPGYPNEALRVSGCRCSLLLLPSSSEG